MKQLSSTESVGKPFSSRLSVSDARGIESARKIRNAAEELLGPLEAGKTLFESEIVVFRRLIKSAPTALGESASELQDIAGVGPRYFDDLHRRTVRPSSMHMVRVLRAIVETANERLLDVEGPHAAQWVKNPFSPTSIEGVHANLLSVVQYLRESNSLSQIPEIDEHWRQTLIRLCETTINVLRSPDVELSLLGKCGKELKRLAALVAPHAVNGAVSGIAAAVAATLLTVAPEQPHSSVAESDACRNDVVVGHTR